MIYKDYEKWNKENIREHGNKMYALLVDEIKHTTEDRRYFSTTLYNK